MMDYDKAKTLAADADPEVRRSLADRTDVRPEILYFLAEDADPAVRAAIAANAVTPRHADALLAKDADVGVRERLAEKIGKLAPGLSSEDRAHIKALTLDVISILAGDRVARVRQIVAEAIKDLVDAPLDVVLRLARDVEIKVAGPILECSPLLSDAELLSIIESKPIQGALAAIARRRRLGMKLADALVATAATAPDGVLAVTALLKNHDSEIDPKTMDRILDLAPRNLAWHEPLVGRPALSGLSMRRLASFVSNALLDVLRRRAETDPGADPETAAALTEIVEHRLAAESGDIDEDADAETAPVGEAAILAAIEASDRVAVAAALARDAGLPRAMVRKILGSASNKAIVALAWKAGWAMALAVPLQTGLAGIPHEVALQPADDGGYPLAQSDMEWQLELFETPAEPKKRRRAAS